MRLTLVALLSATSLVASCAVDDPENIPERGTWEMATRIDSLSIDGMVVPPEQLPAEIRNLNATDSRCGEPVFTDREGQQDILDWRAGGACEFTTYDVDGEQVSTSGQCSSVGGIETFNPGFTATVTQRPRSYRMVVTMEGTAEIPGQGNHYIKLIAVQQGERTGEC